MERLDSPLGIDDFGGVNKKIQGCGESVLSKRNKFPVVHLNMEGVEANSPFLLLYRVKDHIYSLYHSYPELTNSEKLSSLERQESNEVAFGTGRCDIILIPKSPASFGITIEWTIKKD